MERTMRPRPILAALAAIIAGLALAATASPALAGGGPKITPPPGCAGGC
jgi:hypothetical protein